VSPMDIDLNADLGEGAGTDAELMPLITSANVCCGAHAGDPDTIRRTLVLAARHRVTIGAHPGYFDRDNFGRQDQTLSDVQVFNLCAYQIGALIGLARGTACEVRYVKPHGALYNQAHRDDEIALGVYEAARRFELPVIGLPGGKVESICRRLGVPFFAEGFADRRYRPDGSLVPRTEPDAFVHDPDEAVKQVEWLTREKGVRTICVHGDNPEAVAFARAVREALLARGFALKPFA
jgi:UPF0271 protein